VPETPLRFLADESCDDQVVRALRARGHDVSCVGELTPRADDLAVVRHATDERRVLLTEDKDFGWLVFASREDSAGVILIRYPGQARRHLGEDVAAFVQEYRAGLPGSFVVLEPGLVRISRLPS
jgi:predicted nuclease of predicted toxin-antitoxin system